MLLNWTYDSQHLDANLILKFLGCQTLYFSSPLRTAPVINPLGKVVNLIRIKETTSSNTINITTLNASIKMAKVGWEKISVD